MHAERTALLTDLASSYAASLLTLADDIQPTEAMHVTGAGFMLAKTKSGSLRFGAGEVSFSWWRGDTAMLLRDHLVMRMNPVHGRYADDVRRSVEQFLSNPVAWRCEHPLRTAPYFERDYSRRMETP